ncbi:RNF13 [Lepeophtheirus salmonis]|uniref:RNF13 n=1 Tax=Lepeophtheirus salmonis TaxID=72036 RepID=A0A7R8CF57_LEPSM|nr:RNF13 [Lepeophtheirus salmonis]CAF2749221.1 RNF13 [Lepeophtheirus salmonis]
MEASFGHSLPFRGLIGFVKSSEPLDGCSHVQKAPDRYPRDPHWFIILKRSSNCTFIDKVEAATIGNYSAAIVFNDRSDRVFHMGGNSPNLIPSVFIGATDGEKILKKLFIS